MNSTMNQPLPQSENTLPQHFIPSNNHVIIGRGKKSYNHPGNISFRNTVQSRLEEYSQAKTKQAKSFILKDIVRQVHATGGFVKEDPVTGQWMTAGSFLAREKVSQIMRDLLSDGYKSSKASKKKRRQEQLASSSSRGEEERMTTQQTAGKRRRLESDDLEPNMIIPYSEDLLEEIDTSSLESLHLEQDYDIDQVFGFSAPDDELDTLFVSTDDFGVSSKDFFEKFDFVMKVGSTMPSFAKDTDFNSNQAAEFPEFQPVRNISSARTA